MIGRCWRRGVGRGRWRLGSPKRARIVFLAAQGRSNRDIGELVDLHYNQVGIWRQRYGEFGLAGLEDLERSGRPCVYDHDDVVLLVKLVTEAPPEGTTRWSMEALAAAMTPHGVLISASQCRRISRTLDLKPWQVESWLTSHDPDFGRRPATCVGCIWILPTTPWCGAWTKRPASRPSPGLVPPGRPFPASRSGRSSSTAGMERRRCLPHSTSTKGTVSGWVTDSTRSENFVAFLSDLVDQTPAGFDLHCIVDNLSGHKTALVAAFLLDNPHVHVHFTPTHASWLKPVLFFSILKRRLLRCGEFPSVDHLADRIIAFIKDYNRRTAPFRWTYDSPPPSRVNHNDLRAKPLALVGNVGTFTTMARRRHPRPRRRLRVATRHVRECAPGGHRRRSRHYAGTRPPGTAAAATTANLARRPRS